jgi:hypothetical protein
MIKMAVTERNFTTDNPECLIGEENFFLTRGYHKKVVATVARQTKREK